MRAVDAGYTYAWTRIMELSQSFILMSRIKSICYRLFSAQKNIDQSRIGRHQTWKIFYLHRPYDLVDEQSSINNAVFQPNSISFSNCILYNDTIVAQKFMLLRLVVKYNYHFQCTFRCPYIGLEYVMTTWNNMSRTTHAFFGIGIL